MAHHAASRFVASYGMAAVLLLLCAYYSVATLQRQALTGAAAAERCAAAALGHGPGPSRVLVVAGPGADDRQFVEELTRRLGGAGVTRVRVAGGEPREARRAVAEMAAAGAAPDLIVATEECGRWLPEVLERVRGATGARVVTPGGYLWPTFLRRDNLLNVANQIVVIAVVAVGMTLVIVTGGIDLSVGSLVALSAVVAGLLVRDRAGGASAGAPALVACCAAAVAAAGGVGAFSGAMVAFFRVPPFIVTLAMMGVASGLAYELSAGQSISDLPDSFAWLGRGTGLGGLPHAVVLMVLVYAAAHVLMSRTKFGRHVYAVGGNAEAARLSGVRVGRVLMAVYVLSGAAAGVGGVVVASQLKSGSPTYGQSYELYAIAAVVVGGTSLSGGAGKVPATLIGALIIAVIQNGMNLTGVAPYRQKVVLGLVILGAVLLDTLKKRSYRLPGWLRPTPRPGNSEQPEPPPPPADGVAPTT